MPKARAAAQQALKLEPDLAEAHGALAVALAQYDMRWRDAEREYRAALRLDPSDSFTHLFFAQMLMANRRVKEALAEADRARALDPLSPYVQGTSAYFLYVAGRFVESEARYAAMLRSDSSYAVSWYSMAQCEIELGHPAEAIRLMH